jgi:AraC-like DNA-binding protein
LLNALPLWQPAAAPLSRFVLGFWQGNRAAGDNESFRILPDGALDLVWRLGAGAPTALGFGTGTRPRDAKLAKGALYFGLRFRSGSAHRFLDEGDLSDLTDSARESGLRGGGGDLARALNDAEDFPARARILSRHLARLAEQAAAPDLIELAARAIEQGGGAEKIDDLAARLGVTRRHLERLARKQLGVSPKMLARIARFRRAARMIQKGEALSGADLAAACHYVDQAHLIREFQEFAGATPKRFRG